MIRVRSGGYAALIEAAYDRIPQPLHPMVQADFLCGADPLFVGLHQFQDASYGRSYSSTMHVAYPFHQMGLAKCHRRTTVVIPEAAKTVWVEHVVHELGHVLHESLEFEHDASPVSWYGETNRYEAFAEAFTSWLIPGYGKVPDARTRAYFEALI